jgi:tRNA-specific 2-thiouridylase
MFFLKGNTMKIAVGLSGGVDSAVCAFLLKREGHEVIGTIMKIWDGRKTTASRGNSCYGPDEHEDLRDVENLCKALDIPLHVVDCSSQYNNIVLKYFDDEYRSGRTPNPCVMCNQNIKFGILPAMLKQTGVEYDRFATGHYARVTYDGQTNRFLLKKGLDKRKDQSYFLYRLDQWQLSAVVFPIGEYRKTDVRKIASDAGLPVFDKKESQDFYGGDYAELLTVQKSEGQIVDKEGEMLGKHNGTWNYTIGQRKGLKISSKRPLYVVAIDACKNRVIVGDKTDLMSIGLRASNINMIASQLPRTAQAKTRSTSTEAPCSVSLNHDELTIMFDEPQEAITPGQSVVLYDGDIVLGGGTIIEAIKK